MTVIKIIGVHGRVGLKIASELCKHPGNVVYALFRNPDDWDEVAATGATPVLLDLTHAKLSDLRNALKGADVVIWTAGNGGRGSSHYNYEIDRDAAVMSMQASRQLGGVSRFIMISYLGSNAAPQLSRDHPLFHYGQAKHQADLYLRNRSGLKYTIVSPGQLNNQRGSGLVDLHVNHKLIYGRSISRENVARLVSAILLSSEAADATLCREVECLDGEIPILEALSNLRRE